MEQLLTLRSPTRQVTHERHDNTAADLSDRGLARADTKQSLGDEHSLARQPIPGDLHLRTPHLPTTTRGSEVSLTWRAHHQDFYTSKWFRSIQIWIIVSIIVVAIVLYLFISPVLSVDIFASPDVETISNSLLTFLSPVLGLFFILVGGIF